MTISMHSMRSWLDRVVTRLEAVDQTPDGFAYGGANAGIKRNKLDLGLLTFPAQSAVAGVFSQNPLRAPSVQRSSELVGKPGIGAIVINSGNANAMLGREGHETNQHIAHACAQALDIDDTQVLTSSTGVIGVPLPGQLIAQALPSLVESLGTTNAHLKAFAQSILTTDTCTKIAYLRVTLPESGQSLKILGVGKGSGMVHPNMATTLGYICTDANIDRDLLQTHLRESIETTFNAVSVEGDCSTNDMVVAIASGAAQGEHAPAPLSSLSQLDRDEFFAAMHAVLHSLALQVAQDGEGATKLLEICVRGVATHAQAKAIARQIAISPLFKCSVFAGSPLGWGRLAAAAGHAAYNLQMPVDPTRIKIVAQGLVLVEAGTPAAHVDRHEIDRRCQRTRIRWEIDFGDGEASFIAYSCDLTYEFIRINADEARQIVANPNGGIGKRLSLDGYTPTIKHQLLIDALGYSQRFLGLRLMVRPSGVVLEKPQLLAAFAHDLELVVDAGMRPVVILEAEEEAQALEAIWSGGAHRFVRVGRENKEIHRRLDRGQPTLVVAPLRSDELTRFAIELGVQKLLLVGDESGLRGQNGPISAMATRDAQIALANGDLHCDRSEHFDILARAIERGVPAIHLVDGRIVHALVGELFTDEGVGTLVSRQVK
jgi:acetylglutamate kinase